MRKRYCETKLQKLIPCDSGWGAWSNIEKKDCVDDPMEKNCRNIIETDNMRCPFCGSEIEKG